MTPDHASISRQFAVWARDLEYGALPAEVVDKLKALLACHLVSATIGANSEHARDIVEFIIEEEGKPDGARILGQNVRSTRGGAAFANCELMHVSGLYDSYRMITHPGPVLIGAALANSEFVASDGPQLLVSLAAGYEFACRLAHDFVPSTAARGFRPAPIFSTLGAALVSAKMLGLDEESLATTIAIATSLASGLNAAPAQGSRRPGMTEMAVHEPNAARQAVLAAALAATGNIAGSEYCIEGPAGFLATYAGSVDGRLSHVFTGPRTVDVGSITAALGTRYRLRDIMFRMYDCAGFNLPVIELVRAMRAERGLEAADIEDMTVLLNYIETLYPSPEFPRHPDPSVAHVGSTHYYAAHAAMNGGYPVVGGSPYGPTGNDLAHDERVLDFMSRVRLLGVHDQAMFSPVVFIHTRNGDIFRDELPYDRLTWGLDELAERLRECAPGVPGGEGRIAEIVDVVRGLDRLSTLDDLFEVTSPAVGGEAS